MSTTLKPQDVLKMLREARKMPKNSSIINVCGRPAPVSGVAALPMLYELEHGPAPPRAAVTTLPVRPAATSTPKPTGTPTKATATKATATKTTTANTTAARTTTTAAKATATATKPTAKKAVAKKTAGTDTQTSNAGN